MSTDQVVVKGNALYSIQMQLQAGVNQDLEIGGHIALSAVMSSFSNPSNR